MATNSYKPALDPVLVAIAKGAGIETLEERGRDSLDFHDLHVASISAMLRLAFQAGKEAAGADVPEVNVDYLSDGRSLNGRLVYTTEASVIGLKPGQVPAALSTSRKIGNGCGFTLVGEVRGGEGWKYRQVGGMVEIHVLNIHVLNY